MACHDQVVKVYDADGGLWDRIALSDLIIERINQEQVMFSAGTDMLPLWVKSDGSDFTVEWHGLPVLASLDIPQLHDLVQPPRYKPMRLARVAA